MIYVGSWQQMLILEIEQSDTIATVKSKIQDREGFSAEQQRIFVNDVELDDSVRVADIVFRDDLFLELGDDFEIRLLSGETLTVTIKADQTVRSIKEALHFRTRCQSEQQRLVLGGTLLQDDVRFGSYLTQEDLTCHPQVVLVSLAETD